MMATDARPTRATRMNRIACSIAVVHILFFAPFASAAETVDCHVGIYRMSDGRTVDIAPTDGDTLRWRRFDGSTGLLTRTADGLWTSTFVWTVRPDGRAAPFPHGAVAREERRGAGSRTGLIGYQGCSQAGWVVPIAVNREHVDFSIVCFGLAVSVIDEDQQEVEIEMREKGHSPTEIANALQVASAAEAVFASGFTEGFREFDSISAFSKDAR